MEKPRGPKIKVSVSSVLPFNSTGIYITIKTTTTPRPSFLTLYQVTDGLTLEGKYPSTFGHVIL